VALKATIYKADMQISDVDRHYYQLHSLTIARHPSETDERMMIRVLAFARHAGESLSFCKGLSDADEPDLWEKDLTGAIRLWIEVGQPDERRLLKACGRAEQVIAYTYGPTTKVWWDQIARKVERARNLTVIQVLPETSQALASMAQRTMQLQVTVDAGQMWLGSVEQTVQVESQTLREAIP
jgi:uncharacterized protein YaeQ